MQPPVSMTRRLVPAFVVTVVATLVFGAVLVTADVADGTEPLLPASYGVASPMQGDAWTYDLRLSGDWTFGLEDNFTANESVPFGSLAWAGPGRVRGGDGLLHDAERLWMDTLAYRPLWLQEYEEVPSIPLYWLYQSPNTTLGPSEAPYWTLGESGGWVAGGSREVLVRQFREATNASSTQYGFVAGVGAMYTDDYHESGWAQYPEGDVPCLAFNALQGATLSLASSIELFAGCSIGGEMVRVPDGMQFAAREVESAAGVQAIRFEGQKDDVRIHAWFAPASPYPVQLTFWLPSERPAVLEAGERDAPGERSGTLTMRGFAPGAVPLAAASNPGDAAPGLEFAAPMTLTEAGLRAGPDESGLEGHPFPLSEALEMAYASVVWPDLRTYLASNPDAYVAAAVFSEGPSAMYYPGTRIGDFPYTWQVLLHNGQEPFRLVAAKADDSSGIPPAVRDLLTDDPRPPRYDFAQEGYGPGGYYPMASTGIELPARSPYPTQVPALLPTAASLMARWAAFDGSGATPNMYGFAIGCEADRDQDICRPETRYFAGQLRESRSSAAGTGLPGPSTFYGAAEEVLTQRVVAFDERGHAAWMTILDQRLYVSDAGPTSGDLGEPIPDPEVVPDPGTAMQRSSVAGIPSAASAWLPEGKEAASVTFLGAVVGFLYWIWPKLGFMGLFSRVHGPRLLEHPARARLVQLVDANPGIHFHDLAQRAELANGTAVHHLRKLADSGQINVRRSGRYTCYFPAGRVDAAQAAAAPLLKSEGARQVLDAVRARPGLSNLELAQAIGLQPSTVNYHVHRLSQAGLVAPLRDGRNVRLHPGTGVPAGA